MVIIHWSLIYKLINLALEHAEMLSHSMLMRPLPNINPDFYFADQYVKIALEKSGKYENLCAFTDNFPFGISECQCKLSFTKGNFKKEICYTIADHMKMNAQLVYVSLGSDNLLSDFRAIQIIFDKKRINYLEAHFIDKKYQIREFDIYEKSKWIFVMSWLHFFGFKVTIYIHKELKDYIELCKNEPERKAHIFNIWDLGFDKDNCKPYNYDLIKFGIANDGITSYLGYDDSSHYPYYDVYQYRNDKFHPLKIYNSYGIAPQMGVSCRKLPSLGTIPGITYYLD